MQNEEIINLAKRAKGKDPDVFAELMQFQMKDMYRIALAVLMNDEDAAMMEDIGNGEMSVLHKSSLVPHI